MHSSRVGASVSQSRLRGLAGLGRSGRVEGVLSPDVALLMGRWKEIPVPNKKVWFITGAGRGLGVDIAKAALAAGNAVVATGRDSTKVATAIGKHDDLLTLKLDVTRPQDAEDAVKTAIQKFGRIDVLVNNAGNFFAGFFEELSPDQVRNQIETLLFGPMNVVRAALPAMRKQRSGLLLTISSTAGIAGGMFCSA